MVVASFFAITFSFLIGEGDESSPIPPANAVDWSASTWLYPRSKVRSRLADHTMGAGQRGGRRSSGPCT